MVCIVIDFLINRIDFLPETPKQTLIVALVYMCVMLLNDNLYFKHDAIVIPCLFIYLGVVALWYFLKLVNTVKAKYWAGEDVVLWVESWHIFAWL
jgi:hypothetical protein